MTAVLARHRSLFLPNLVVFLVQLRSLRRAELALFALLVNPLVLVRQATAHLGTTRMILLPRRRCKARACNAGDERDRESENKCFAPSLNLENAGLLLVRRRHNARVDTRSNPVNRSSCAGYC